MKIPLQNCRWREVDRPVTILRAPDTHINGTFKRSRLRLPRLSGACKAHPSRSYGGQSHRPLKCTALLGPLITSLPSPATGWLIAGSILTAVRLGRKQAEDDRALRIQRESWEWLEEDQQSLLQKRVRERSRNQESAETAAKRIEEAQAKAQQEESVRRAENERLKLVIDAQKQKAEEARRAEQEAYENQEAQLKAELQARAEEERKLRAQYNAERRQKEAERRRQEEDRRRVLEIERLDREAEMKRQEQLALEMKIEERRQIKRLSKTFTLTLDTAIQLDIPPEGTETAGRLPRDAVLDLLVSAGTFSGGSASYGPIAFESVEACEGQLCFQVTHGCYLGAERFAANARLQNMMGQGPLASMTEAELVHWTRFAAVRASRSLMTPVMGMLKDFGKRRQHKSQKFQVKTTRSILPDSDSRRVAKSLTDTILAVEAEDPSKATRLLNHLIEEESVILAEDNNGASMPENVAASLTLALFLDEMWNQRPARRVEASPWYESASNLACQILTERCSKAPKDSLQEVRQIVTAVLPEDHVIGQVLTRLAEANLSDKTRQTLRENEELIQAEIAERLVEFEWPDKSQLSAAKLKEIEASVPIPERVWALKNVGATQAMSGPEGRSRARQLLERAVGLKKELVGSGRHPGMLPEYDALANLLEKEPEWQRDASALRLRMLSIFTDIAESFVRAGEEASAVILLEASVRKIEQSVDPKQPDLGAATNRANQLFATLDDSQKEKVKAHRLNHDVVRKVIAVFEEELAARQTTGTLLQYERWNEENVNLLKPIFK